MRTSRISRAQSKKDWTINVGSRVLTRKNAPSPSGHIFHSTSTIFELVQDIIWTNLLTKFHEDRKNVGSRGKNAPPPGGNVFQQTEKNFEHVQDIICTNLLNKFHEDRTINVASRVLTRQILTTHDSYRITDKK
ncbi:hypothetical protein DPMN_060884 [Dreissena polymorpha]|uniref:Uncharacterized protein n=1 Tax=Dreissena polymorpha TaxID=45954 RepID=A0A9D4HGC9_DREPO|nr:hypothetical protein DPMN_060884 [Dreissena polymorpha]